MPRKSQGTPGSILRLLPQQDNIEAAQSSLGPLESKQVEVQLSLQEHSRRLAELLGDREIQISELTVRKTNVAELTEKLEQFTDEAVDFLEQTKFRRTTELEAICILKEFEERRIGTKEAELDEVDQHLKRLRITGLPGISARNALNLSLERLKSKITEADGMIKKSESERELLIKTASQPLPPLPPSPPSAQTVRLYTSTELTSVGAQIREPLKVSTL